MKRENAFPEWIEGDKGLTLFLGIACVVAITIILNAVYVAHKNKKNVDWGDVIISAWDSLGITVILCIIVTMLIFGIKYFIYN